MIYFTKPSGRVNQAKSVIPFPRASNWLASLAVIGLFASPAYGQGGQEESACGTGAAPESRVGQGEGGCQLQYPRVTTPGSPEIPAVDGVYEVTIDGVTYRAEGTVILGDETDDILTLTTPDSSDSDGDGNPRTVTYTEREGTAVTLRVVSPGTALVPMVVEVTTPTGGANAVSLGMGSIVKGHNSVAVGAGAVVGVRTEMQAEIPAVDGVYEVTIDGNTYRATGSVILGDGLEDVLTLEVEDMSDRDGDGNSRTVTYVEEADSEVTLGVITAARALVPEVMPSFQQIEDGTAIGANSVVSGAGGVAIGSGASAAANGIAVGAGVTAGANQIRIGSTTQTDVRIGAYDLSNVPQIPANTAAIARNTDDIETNRAGVASAVAIANLPSVQGPTGGWSLALGSFDGETAIAGGINFDVFTSSIVKISVASSDGETSAGVGFGMGF